MKVILNHYIKSLQYVKPHIKKYILIVILIVIVIFISIIPTVLIKFLIDEILPNKDITILNMVLLGAFIIYGISLLLDLIQDYLSSIAVSNINFSIQTDFFKHLQKLPIKFFNEGRIGKLLYRIFIDTGSIQMWVSNNLLTVFVSICSIIVIGGFMLYMNWRLCLLSFAIMLFHILNIMFFYNPIRKYNNRLSEEEQLIYADSIEYLSGIREIKTYVLEKQIENKFTNNLSRKFKLEIKSRLIGKFYNTIIDFFNNTWVLLILWFGSYQFIKGYITIGYLMAFLVLAGRIYKPITNLTNLIIDFQEDSIRMNRVYEVLNLLPEDDSSKNRKSLPEIKGEIKFENLSFAYNGNEPVLKEVTFNIKPGECVAIVGKSGVGKTTICNLIIGLYRYKQGRIYIDGYDLQSLRLESLRKQIGIVSQNPFLFSGTIKENLLYGKFDADEEEIQEACIKANIHSFIKSLPEGYDTEIWERGVRLSGGEKQRIAIARAFLRNPMILIFDEATSFLDLESERNVQSALKQLKKGRTTIIVAHRLSTILEADNIFVLEDGKIVESGSHNELLKKEGVYYQLYKNVENAEMGKFILLG